MEKLKVTKEIAISLKWRRSQVKMEWENREWREWPYTMPLRYTTMNESRKWTGPREGWGTKRGFDFSYMTEVIAFLCAENKVRVEWEKWWCKRGFIIQQEATNKQGHTPSRIKGTFSQRQGISKEGKQRVSSKFMIRQAYISFLLFFFLIKLLFLSEVILIIRMSLYRILDSDPSAKSLVS